jgi:predicted dehydrogenase
MKKWTAVVSCGAIAREYLTAMQDMDDVQVAAICDLSPARVEATAERFGIGDWSADYEHLLHKVQPDLVDITSPPSSHFPIAKHCLERRLNMLCEKLITVDYEHFKILKQLATNNGCMFLENQNLHCHSSILRILKLLESEAFGDLSMCRSFFHRPFGSRQPVLKPIHVL